MRLLLIADTHGNDGLFEQVLRETGPVDMLLHAGDLEGSGHFYRDRCDHPVLCVAGNNDPFSDLPAERLIEVEGLRIWLVHGHRQHVFRGLSELAKEAGRRGAGIVVYGHTHRPEISRQGSLLLVNPGSLSEPRGRGCRPSWAVLDIQKGQITDCRICHLSTECG